MTVTEFDIISQAHALLRADPVSSYSDGTNEAEIAQLMYPNFAQDILTRYPWTFATKKRQLNQAGSTPVNEYSYYHILPSECLRLWALYNSDAVGAKTIRDYDIFAPSGQRWVASNHATLYADYTIYASEADWPPYFVSFAVKAYAALVAMAITDQPDLANMLHTQAWGPMQDNGSGGAFAIACRINAMQKPGEQIIASPLVESRFA